MSAFAKTVLHFQKQDEFWRKTSKRFWENESGIPNFHKSFTTLQDRFSNPAYIQNTYSTKIQPVIKIISKQTGLTQVRRLLDYIAREAKERSEHLSLEDDTGKIYNHKEQRESNIRKWQQDFFSKEAYEKQQWKLDLMEKLEKRRNKLLKIPDYKLNEFQTRQIDDLTDQIDNQYYISKTKKYDLKMSEGVDAEKQQWKLDLMETLKKRRDKLLKIPDSKITEVQKQKIDDLTDQIDKQYYISEAKKYDLKMRGATDTTHILLSVGGKPNEEKATKAVRAFLQENFAAQGFKYMFVKHSDTDNLHFHLVVKNKSELGQKLYFDKSDLFTIRQEFARHLSLNGIERVSTLRKDRSETLEKIISQTENVKKQHNWYHSQLNKTAKKDQNFDVFTYRANLLKQTQFLIKNTSGQILKTSGNDKKNLKSDLKTLQELKKELKTIDKDNFEIAKEKTLEALSKDNQQLIVKIQNLNSTQNQPKKLTPNQKKKNRDYLKTLLTKHTENLKTAKEAIKSESLKSFNEKEKNKKILQDIDKMIKKSKAVVKGKGIGF